MARRPKKCQCVECGADVMSFRDHAKCSECLRAMGRSGCLCEFPDWNRTCPVHTERSPYEIPY